MSENVIVQVPDIGDAEGVEVVEVLVEPGQQINAEDSLITLESDKAAMEVPSPHSGVVARLLVEVGAKVNQGDPIAEMTVGAQEPGDPTETRTSTPAGAEPAAAPAPAAEKASIDAPAPAAASGESATVEAEVLVLGSGPGGYSAAFRAADLGKKVAIVERYSSLGGVCLNVGCIPSKALLHSAEIINEARSMGDHGIRFGEPEIDIDALRANKDGIVGQLTNGVATLARLRKITVVTGEGQFISPHEMRVSREDGSSDLIRFDNAIIAAGSQSTQIPGFPYDDERLMSSTGALQLRDIPERMLVIGGGIIGLEMSTVYQALGSRITIVELSPGLIPGCDRDLVKPLEKRLSALVDNVYLNAKVSRVESEEAGLRVYFDGEGVPESEVFDRVLLSVGRRPNGKLIGAENAGVAVDERGFIPVDKQQRTNAPHIFAIGDIVGQPMLAHKASHEGKVAAEVIAGHKAYFDAKTIPSVAYTDPEVAWMGLTETEAKAQGIAYEKGVFPWTASGRSLSIGRSEGRTKVLCDPETKRILGVGIVGPNAGELIAEAVLALEMGADLQDLSLTIHAHPTLSETVAFAAEVAEGTVTEIYAPKRKR